MFWNNGIAAGGGDYEIAASARFNYADSAYLNRTPASSGNRKTWTFSAWIKRTALGSGGGPNTSQEIFGVGAGSRLRFTSDNKLRLESPSNHHTFITDRVFRDTNAWYHIVVVLDTTEADQDDRAKLWVNGEQITDFTSRSYTELGLNADWDVNHTSEHQIGKSNTTDYSDMLMAEVYLVDGQAMTASDFGEFDSATPTRWKPKRPSISSYGTNGFYLDFEDAGELGKDANTAYNFCTNPSGWSWTDNGTFYGTYGTDIEGNDSYAVEDTDSGARSRWGTTISTLLDDDTYHVVAVDMKYVDVQTSILFAFGGGIQNQVILYCHPEDGTYSLDGSNDPDYYGVIDLGGGWYRYWHTIQTTAAGTGVNVFIYPAWNKASKSTSSNNADLGTVEFSRFRIDTGITGDSAFPAYGTTTGNDFTSKNLLVDDQRGDTPTLNHATFNVLANGRNNDLTNGNLEVGSVGIANFWNRSLLSLPMYAATYFEMEVTQQGSWSIGITREDDTQYDDINNPAGNYGAYMGDNERFVTGSVANESAGVVTFNFAQGDRINYFFDPVREALWLGIDGVWTDPDSAASSATILAEIEGSGTTYAAFTGLSAEYLWFAGFSGYNTNDATLFVEEGDFETAMPSGGNVLSNAQIPTPDIKDPGDYMNTVLYTGNGTAIGSGGQAVTGVGFQPDFVNIYERNTGNYHDVYDSARGATKRVYTALLNQEDTEAESLTSFDSDGFTLGSDAGVNENTKLYLAVCLKEGVLPAFDIVEYTGNSDSSQAISHNLGVTPELILAKRLNGANHNWRVFHKTPGVGETANLNSNNGWSADPDRLSAVSTTTFTAQNNMNVNTHDYVAYVFASVPQFCRVGSYIGNGQSDGPFIFTGGVPGLLWIKSDSTEEWALQDISREPFNRVSSKIQSVIHTNTAETDSATRLVDFLSGGFKIRHTNTAHNTNGQVYHYVFWAAEPVRYANAH